MTTEAQYRALLKQALDALNAVSGKGRLCEAAISAIRAALAAQPAAGQYTDIISDGGMDPRNAAQPAGPATVNQAQTKKSQRLPVAYMFDWYPAHDDGGDELIRDRVTTDYDEAHSPTMGCYNIRPLYLKDDA
jgi:hypothetical protein